ncbi:MAG: hypothetical protein LC739_05920 [Actinobacteria bacterium]|nr:hypothetical protein [Actinomycetota bacterium]
MLATRLANDNIPRRGLLDDYRRIRAEAISVIIGGSLETISADLQSLLTETDLPTSLRSAARVIVDRQDRSKLVDLIGAVSREIGRIEIAIIASFIHPNKDGARQYADRIVIAYNDHQRYSIRRAVGSMRTAGQRGVQLGAATKRHSFDSSTGIRGLAPIARIESVAVQFEGLSSGIHPISISLGGASVDCVVTRSGSSGRQFLAFDLALDLGNLTEFSLTQRIPPIPIAGAGGIPKFDKVTVFLNAREFMSLRADQGRRDGDTLVLWTAR